MKPLLLTLMGPTASGKTLAAIELAKTYPVEIVSVDSAMVYRGMDIGTGKPSPAQLALAKHHLIDVLDPADRYSAADFCRDALALIQDILKRGKTPMLVGGTMMYFHALIHGLAIMPSADAGLRRRLADQWHRQGAKALHEQLQSVDPKAAAAIHPNDPQRLLRALEVYELTGVPMSALQQKTAGLNGFDLCQCALLPPDRAKLHKAIEQRFFAMLKKGFVEEVQVLRQRGDLTLDHPSMRSVGYRQIWQYLAGQLSPQAMQEKAVAATRQLAKRQFTWLRRWQGLNAFSSPLDFLEQVGRLTRLG